MGVTVGSGMATTLVLMSACKASGSAPATPSPTTAPPPTTSQVADRTTSSTAGGSTTPTAAATTKPAASTAAGAAYGYIPPSVAPEVIHVPDSECTVAKDRLYSYEHIWVKTIAGDIVVLGVTTTLVAILYEPHTASLPDVGQKISRDQVFGELGGYKTSCDLIAPVSGEVLEINSYLKVMSDQVTVFESLMSDTYNGGWLAVVRLSKPAELDDLLTPQGYFERLGKLESA